MSQPYVGQILMFGGNFAPAGWMMCAGQTLPISENDVLFNLIGTTYGGDGEETFMLPNLQSRVPIHMGQGSGLSNYQIGQTGGTENVTLTTQQIPSHNHMVQVVNNPASSQFTPSGSTILCDESSSAGAGNNPFTWAANDAGTQVQLKAGQVANTGGSQPHENLQPYLAVNYVISLFGVYPSPT